MNLCASHTSVNAPDPEFEISDHDGCSNCLFVAIGSDVVSLDVCFLY